MYSRRLFVEAMAAVSLSALPSQAAEQATQRPRSERRRILVFDVNETMLDINALAPLFARAFGNEQVLRKWFSTVLLYSNVASLAGPYADFGAIAGAALDISADRNRRFTSPHRHATPPHTSVSQFTVSLTRT